MAILFLGRPAPQPQPWHLSHSRPQPGHNRNSRPLADRMTFDENGMQSSSLYTLNDIVRGTCGYMTPFPWASTITDGSAKAERQLSG